MAEDDERDTPAGLDPYEDFDFQPYFQETKSEDELRQTWRVFTKVKDVLDNGRRLENASWRMWFRERNKAMYGEAAVEPPAGAAQDVSTLPQVVGETQGAGDADEKPRDRTADAMVTAAHGRTGDRSGDTAEKYNQALDQSLKKASTETDRFVDEMFGNQQGGLTQDSTKRAVKRKGETTRKLLELKSKHALDDELLDEVLYWVRKDILEAEETSPNMLPENMKEADELMKELHIRPRRRCLAFSHSLERNGANNFLIYLVRELKDEFLMEVVAPKAGPMQEDYESMGVRVHFADMKDDDYSSKVSAIMKDFRYVVANTIMCTEAVIAAKSLGVPSLWVIHEAWPKDQFEYYAKEVFLMQHLDADKIREAFANASKIIFPANVQRNCYEGLFHDNVARVIYNGIPLASIDAYRKVQSREKVRSDLGYTKDNIVMVQMGTVCKRKGQLYTAKAFGRLVGENGIKQARLLMVGARYIRQHEIDYIEECKSAIRDGGGEDYAQILDVHKNVLPFYLAADIILCPSLNEVLPLVICEAMAFERPIIATKIDGIPEALDDNVEGFLIPPGEDGPLRDAMLKMVNSGELRDKMGKAGRRRVLKQFSFKVMMGNYRDAIYDDLKEEA